MLVTLRFYVRQPIFFANHLVDPIRAVCAIAAVVLIFNTARLIAEQRRRGGLAPGQFKRFAGGGLAILSIAYTEVIAQGSPATVRLGINIAAIVLLTSGNHDMRREQKRRQTR